MIPAALLHEDTAQEWVDRYASLTAAGWDESEHPRHPRGTPVEGGRFAPKGEDVFQSEPEDFTTVLGHMTEMEKLWADQTQEAMNYSDTLHLDRYAEEAIAAKIWVQDKIALKLKGDEDFKSLYEALDPFGDWKSEFEPGGQMATATTLEQQTAALAIKGWSLTSGDHDPAALQMQLAAELEFGLEANPFIRKQWDEYTEAVERSETGSGQIFTEEQMSGARKFLRAQYDLTQEMFQAYGITHVYSFRGMRFDEQGAGAPPQEIQDSLTRAREEHYADVEDAKTEAVGRPPRMSDYAGQDIMSVHQNPLSSWAHMFYPAHTFSAGGTVRSVAGTKVDVRRIISTPFTGYGCLDEAELVVLGDKDMDAMVWSWTSDMYEPDGDRAFHEAWSEAATRAYEKRKEDRVGKR